MKGLKVKISANDGGPGGNLPEGRPGYLVPGLGKSRQKKASACRQLAVNDMYRAQAAANGAGDAPCGDGHGVRDDPGGHGASGDGDAGIHGGGCHDGYSVPVS